MARRPMGRSRGGREGAQTPPPPPGKKQVAIGFLSNSDTDPSRKAIGLALMTKTNVIRTSLMEFSGSARLCLRYHWFPFE